MNLTMIINEAIGGVGYHSILKNKSFHQEDAYKSKLV